MDSPLAPLLRPEAERLAREFYDALCDGSPQRRVGMPTMPWGAVEPEVREEHVAAHLALLLDLTRPASMDALARIVAGRVGLKVGATAPSWVPHRFEFSDGRVWRLFVPYSSQGAVSFSRDRKGMAALERWIAADVDDVEDPAEALTLAALSTPSPQTTPEPRR